MKTHDPILKPMRLHARKNWLWLWILPAALSLLLVTLARPKGGAAFWVELGIISACSCLCGFALAVRSFSTFKERLWGGLFFAGGSLCVMGSVVFIGCVWQPYGRALTPAERQQQEFNRMDSVRKRMIQRDSRADPSMLDLTSFYDALLPGQSPGLRALKPGTHSWHGIKFDVRAVVMTRNQVPPDGQISGIPVGQKCAGIAFLHGEYYANNDPNPTSRFVVHYAKGHAETVPLVFGGDLPLNSPRNNLPNPAFPMTNSVVWAERTSTNGPFHPETVFYIKKWVNPFPGETVATIDFVPWSIYSNPFLVAITLLAPNP